VFWVLTYFINLVKLKKDRLRTPGLIWNTFDKLSPGLDTTSLADADRCWQFSLFLFALRGEHTGRRLARLSRRAQLAPGGGTASPSRDYIILRWKRTVVRINQRQFIPTSLLLPPCRQLCRWEHSHVVYFVWLPVRWSHLQQLRIIFDWLRVFLCVVLAFIYMMNLPPEIQFHSYMHMLPILKKDIF
jgi:hypothetical protein